MVQFVFMYLFYYIIIFYSFFNFKIYIHEIDLNIYNYTKQWVQNSADTSLVVVLKLKNEILNAPQII